MTSKIFSHDNENQLTKCVCVGGIVLMDQYVASQCSGTPLAEASGAKQQFEVD